MLYINELIILIDKILPLLDYEKLLTYTYIIKCTKLRIEL
jgi:hypothetical protein